MAQRITPLLALAVTALAPMTPRRTAAIAFGCGAGSGFGWSGEGQKP